MSNSLPQENNNTINIVIDEGQHPEKDNQGNGHKWSLERFFKNQLDIDKLQVDFMSEYYEDCHKIHMEKKLQRKKRKEGFGETYSQSWNKDDFETFLSIIQEHVDAQSDIPRRQSEDEPLRIGEEGWLILSHWMQPLFKKQVNGYSVLEMHCDLCRKHEEIGQAFEKFTTERRCLFEGTPHTPLKVFEKYVDIWNQGSYLGVTRYELSDHGCSDIFGKGILNCTLTHFILTRDLQGKIPEEPHQIVCLLSALEQNTSIYSIDLSALLIVHDSVAKAICNLIRKKRSLKRMVFSNLSLSKSVYSSNMIDAIAESTLTRMEIYIYEELDSNFRFLENVDSSSLKKLAGKKGIIDMIFVSYDYTFPIDFISLFEELLKNKSINYFQYEVNSVQDENDEYLQFCDKLNHVISTTEEFNFGGFHFPNIDAHHEFYITKHAKKLDNGSGILSLLEKAAENKHYQLGTAVCLTAKNLLKVGFSHVASFFGNIVKLTFGLSNLKEEELVLFSQAILNSPVLEKMHLYKIRKLGVAKQVFSEHFKVTNSSKLRKIILADFTDTTLVSDAFTTFLDLNYFPQLTALYIRGEDVQFDFKVMETLVTCIHKQEIHFPKGLKKLELPEECIEKPEFTEYLLQSLMHNRLLETLGISRAPLKNIEVFIDFIVTNKSISELKLNYSDCTNIPKELSNSEEFTAAFLKVFGAFQINWQLVAIDWYMEYYWNEFVFGTCNHTGERFLVQRIMDRNKEQKHINILMQPIFTQEKYNRFLDVSVTFCQ